ncbi:hypothetical protein NC661_21220 [Aquibacillus koreensis]|uniref:MucB/RseB N-terminal domain-containing protein n=1 Tax=Aquibacillus koreensis TaxID=279446 RepID=A0A9X3WQI6_9BACI|nr:hypothetical protein [Aquibacillus koreensis]MDC3422868.1 hypothetical protein [Aquibacillus koreensis]
MRKIKNGMIGLVTLVLIGIGGVVTYHQISDVNASTVIESQKGIEIKGESVDVQKINNNVSGSTSTSLDPISKEDIHNRMLNSIDNFDTVKGSFIYKSDSANFNDKVDYQVKLKNKPSSYVKISSEKTGIEETSFDGETLTNIFHENKNYRKGETMKYKLSSWDKEKYKSPKDRYGKKDGETVYIRRDDPSFMGLAQTSVFPQMIALGYLEDYNSWNILNEEKYLNLDAVVIKGTFNDFYQRKFETDTFKLWVHKDTGILLKMEGYKTDGQVGELLETTSIKINGSLDDSKFKLKEPKDYKDQLKVKE